MTLCRPSFFWLLAQMTDHAFFFVRMSRRQGSYRVTGYTPLFKLDTTSALLQLQIKTPVGFCFRHILAERLPCPED